MQKQVHVKSTEVAPRHARNVSRRGAVQASKDFRAYTGLLTLISVLVLVSGSWAAQVLLVPLLLVVPGLILLRALRVPGATVASFPVYVPAASLVVLLGSGLMVDLLGMLVGVAAPLRPAPLLVGLDLTCMALLWASRRASQIVAINWGGLSRSARLAWPLILPLVSAAGALRLNSGHRNTVALVAVALCVAVIVGTFLVAHILDKTLLAVLVYAIGLGMMWSFSLRGDLVYGFDIATEYYDMHQTVTTGVWHVTHVGDAYGAMLAVTVLPALLHFLSGVPALMVFKVVYPVIGALFPVAVFGLAQRVLSRRWAFLAAAFIVIQGPFAQQLSALARQQIALVFFAALVMAMLDVQMPRNAQWALAFLFGASMVASHYSTTYVAIFLIGSAFALQWVVSWFRPIPRVTGSVVVAFGAAAAGAIIWYGPVTHADAGVGQLLQTIMSHGLNPVASHAHGKKLVSAVLHSNPMGHGRASAYERYIHDFDVVHRKYIVPLPQASLPQYALHNAHVAYTPPKWPSAYNFLNQYALYAQQVAVALAAIGALLMVLRRKTSSTARIVGLIALVAVVFLIMMQVSTTLALAYGETRALLQGSVVLGIALGWTLERLSGWRKLQRATVAAIVATSVTGMFIYASWLGAAIFNGSITSNLTNSGEDVQRFVMTAPELAAARWLGQARQPNQLTYADRYALLRLITATGLARGLLSDVTPLTLNQHAWIYASRTNVIDREANAAFGDKVFTYAFPFRYLNNNYDLVYTNGSSKVFYR